MQHFSAQILPDTDLFDGDKMIPLSDPQFREIVVRSLQDWTEKVQPSVLIQHDEDGGHYGRVLRVYEDWDGIFVDGIITDPQVASRMSNGGYRFVSPTIAWNFAADDYIPDVDNRWPAALLEVSLVSVPRHYTRQPDLQAYDAHTTQLSEAHASSDTYYVSNSARIAAALSEALSKYTK
jgi:phage head maturation protease